MRCPSCHLIIDPAWKNSNNRFFWSEFCADSEISASVEILSDAAPCQRGRGATTHSMPPGMPSPPAQWVPPGSTFPRAQYSSEFRSFAWISSPWCSGGCRYLLGCVDRNTARQVSGLKALRGCNFQDLVTTSGKAGKTERLTFTADEERFSNRPFGVKHFQTVHRCSVLMSLAGSRFSSDSALRPFQYGIRRRGGTIFGSTLPSD